MSEKLAAAKLKRVGAASSDVPKTENNERVCLPPPVLPKCVDKSIVDATKVIPAFLIQPSFDRGGKGKMIKHTYPTVFVGVTNIVWTRILKDMGEDSGWICDLIDSYMSTNNTALSSLVRAKAQLPTKEFNLKYEEETIKYVHDHLPLKRITDVVTTPDWDNSEIFDIIESADAGMPFMADDAGAKCGNVEVYAEAVALAEKYLVMLRNPNALEPGDSKNFLGYMKTHKLEFTYMLKRKFERAKRCDFDVKCRSYYVAPYALKLLFKWVSYYSRRQTLSFFDNCEVFSSASAYKFCWSRGGADKIIEWVLRNRRKSALSGLMVFDAICFGDDQLWVFVYPSGHINVMCPDVAGMDMNVASVVGKRELARHINSFVKEPSIEYQNVCKLLANHAFKQMVLVHGSIVVFKMYGLISGVPLTTQLDIHCSVVAHRQVELMVKSLNVGKGVDKPILYDKNVFDTFIKTVVSNIKTRVGLTLKPDTLEYECITPTQQFGDFNINLKFLGYKISYDDELLHYYPVPDDLDHCWPSLALPSSPIEKGKAMDVLLARIYGLLLSGYCYNQKFYDFCIELFAYIKGQGAMVNSSELNELVLNKYDMVDFMVAHPEPLTVAETKKFYMFGPEHVEKVASSGKVVVSAENTKTFDDLIDQFGFDLPLGALAGPPISSDRIGETFPKPKPPPKLALPKKQSQRKDRKSGNNHIDNIDELDDDNYDLVDEEEQKVEDSIEQAAEEYQRQLDMEREREAFEQEEDEDLVDLPNFHLDFAGPEEVGAEAEYASKRAMGMR